MTESQALPLIVVCLLIAAAASSHRLKRAAQPLRLQLAEQGEALIVDPNLPKHLRGYVRLLLESAFDNRTTLLIGLVYVPVIAIQIMLNPKAVSKRVSGLSIHDKGTREKLDELRRIHDRITLANNPFLLLLLELEILVIVPASVPLPCFVLEILPERPDRNTTLGVVEVRSAEFKAKHLKAA